MPDNTEFDALAALAGDTNEQGQSSSPEMAINLDAPQGETEGDVDPFAALTAPVASTDKEANAETAKARSKPAMSIHDSIAAKKSRVAKLKQKQSSSASLTFRKTATPLLLVMGSILIILGIVTAMLGNDADEQTRVGNPLMEHWLIFTVVCGLIGVALIGGAFLFQWEIKRSKAAAKN